MSSGKALLLIGADALLRGALAESLRAGGSFAVVHEAASAAEALLPPSDEALEAPSPDRTGPGPWPPGPWPPGFVVPDLVVIDATAPDPTGRATLAALREAGMRAPALRLVAPGTVSPDDALPADAPEEGEVMTKPVRLAELLARLAALRPCAPARTSPPLPVGAFWFHPDERMLIGRADGARIRLTDKESALLAALCRHGDTGASREALLHEVWDYGSAVDTHTLETHVYRLRRKLDPDPAQESVLLTTEGGYRLSVSPALPV
ncbi:winged helix-turn-helix domain-containing protein [Pararhodospirillum oryzae]|uniref:Transcriptional regulator n=1 Tax=Pararhodospirillum oryzae TaxID=478448 RepID=A0A512H5R7_9PROT|nr:winged helix-turn-helix domain-containing protein [Pararhodospirillum oryzae]GEO80815.1 transcriptional regulator [Pararhodospirillum oryzae]